MRDDVRELGLEMQRAYARADEMPSHPDLGMIWAWAAEYVLARFERKEMTEALSPLNARCAELSRGFTVNRGDLRDALKPVHAQLDRIDQAIAKLGRIPVVGEEFDPRAAGTRALPRMSDQEFLSKRVDIQSESIGLLRRDLEHVRRDYTKLFERMNALEAARDEEVPDADRG